MQGFKIKCVLFLFQASLLYFTQKDVKQFAGLAYFGCCYDDLLC